MQLIDYLNTHFLTGAQLPAANGITAARLDAPGAGGGMPQECATGVLKNACPNCGGEMVRVAGGP